MQWNPQTLQRRQAPLAVLAVVLAIASLPAAFYWLLLSLVEIPRFGQVLRGGAQGWDDHPHDWAAAAFIALGWLAWVALAFALARFRRTGHRPMPWWVLIGLLGGVTIDLFFVLAVWREAASVKDALWGVVLSAPAWLAIVCVRRERTKRRAHVLDLEQPGTR